LSWLYFFVKRKEEIKKKKKKNTVTEEYGDLPGLCQEQRWLFLLEMPVKTTHSKHCSAEDWSPQ
jgi:hypothetical protein